MISAILLAAPSQGETAPFGVGVIPAIGAVSAAVAARLPDDDVYDPITYKASPNKGVFAYDNGFGRIHGRCDGSINYESGKIVMRNAPRNAEFVVNVMRASIIDH